ncbi:MAG: Clp protease ClpP [Spirochaetaceae bacterium]|jgi:ATP-dependent protease ClpP protease subunit|nr:Clp protease ClpP [Spirochaetaceae bacterium]
MKKILIDGEIGYDWWTESGVTAKTVKEQLAGLSDGEDIEIEINSPGGSVYEGVVIFNLIRDAAKTHPVSVRINCMALSMASYIALAARTVDRDSKISASDNSVLLIHNPYGGAWGDYRLMRNEAEYLEKLSNMYGSVHALVAGKDIGEIRAAMDKETYYVGKEIADAGFANDYEAITQEEPGTPAEDDQARVFALNRDGHIVKASAALQEAVNHSMSALVNNKRRALDDLQNAAALAGNLNGGGCASNGAAAPITGVGSPAALAGGGCYDNSNPGAEPAGNKGGAMKPEDLLAQDKACYDAVFALGGKAALEEERRRVAAHIKRGEKCGAMDIALKHIQGGKSVVEEDVNEEYFAAALDKRREAARLRDNVPPLGFSGDGEGADDAALAAVWDAGVKSSRRGNKGGAQ